MLPMPDRPAPVVPHQHHVAEVERVDHRERVVDVAAQAVRGQVRRLVGAAEAHVVERHATVAGRRKVAELVPPEVAPGGVAVDQQQGRGVPRTLVHVVQPGRVGLHVPGGIRKRALEVAVEGLAHGPGHIAIG